MNKQENFQLNHVNVHASNENSQTLILQNINLCISQGEWISIVGKNGSGKSSLAQLLAGIRTPSSGSIDRGFCGDEPIPYVMQQDLQWFGETPWEDMVFLLESRGENPLLIPEIIRASLHKVGMGSLGNQRFAELSGGQKQLAAIAGCLAVKAPILVFDEATSMLDSTSRLQVLDAAKTVNRQGTAVIWLTHHMEDLSFGERVIALEEGRIGFNNATTSFFYQQTFSQINKAADVLSPCEKLGFSLPYAIQLAHELRLQGIRLPFLPLNTEQFLEVVNQLVH